MRRLILIPMLVFALLSCGGGNEEVARIKPDGVLTKDSMAFYLGQVHLMESTMKNREVRKKGLQDEARKAFVHYFDTAGVSESRFKRSLDYWKDDFEAMQDIYDLSMEQLSTKMARLKQGEGEEEDEGKVSKLTEPKTRVEVMKEELAKRHGRD